MAEIAGKIEIPQLVEEILNTTQEFSGGLFSSRKETPSTEFNVLDWRWGSGHIVDMKTKERKHPTVEFLLKNDNMKRSRWTRGFACRDFVPCGEEGWKKIQSK